MELNGEEKKGEREGASVTVNLIVEDVLGRAPYDEKEREAFLAVISSFFSSEFVYLQLKAFVKSNFDTAKDTGSSHIISTIQ